MTLRGSMPRATGMRECRCMARIVLTRSLDDVRAYAPPLEALGLEVVAFPVTRTVSAGDPDALVRALADGTIKAAGLDVFADEPRIPDELLTMDNVVLLPHVGSATRETRQAMADLCKANLDAWFGERKTLTLVPELASRGR